MPIVTRNTMNFGHPLEAPEYTASHQELVLHHRGHAAPSPQTLSATRFETSDAIAPLNRL